MLGKYKILILFAGVILLLWSSSIEWLYNYDNQVIPKCLIQDNMPNANPIDDNSVALGLVLFYDKNLSSNNTLASASCHK
ncbi:MAG: cytochrome c peroxidase [Glaciecola sp.]